MMLRSDKIRFKRGLIRMNKLSYFMIVLFLIISLSVYMKIEPRPTGTIFLIQCITIFIVFGGMKHLIGIGLDGMSDGIDLPGVDL